MLVQLRKEELIHFGLYEHIKNIMYGANTFYNAIDLL